MEDNYKKTVTNDTATLSVRGKSYELPIYGGSTGPEVIDISTLYRDTNMFTYDPGFTSTASCESTITYIDGDKGELLYRGYPIEQLADKSDFLEVAYLLHMANSQTKSKIKNSKTILPITLWFTNKLFVSLVVSDVMPILWQLCVA